MAKQSASKSQRPGPLKQGALKVIGVGGAGCNAVEHMARGGFEEVTFVALNTDLRALAACRAAHALPLASPRTRGLGAGGDPEIGRAAAEENAEQLRELCEGTDLVMIAAGMGGGTGTGASPVVARIARETGALVMGVVALPFDCEGVLRRGRAEAGLEELKTAADAVICLPNERMLKLIDENTPINETFRICNEHLTQGVSGVWRLLTRNGIINVDFADVCAVVRGSHAESCFAAVESRGEHRSREVLDKLNSHPLLENGALLGEAASILVSLVGGPDLSMAEVNRIMAQINRRCENARIVVGAAVDETFGDRLAVTVIAARSAPECEPGLLVPGSARAAVTSSFEAPPDGQREADLLPQGETTRPPSRFLPPAPELTGAQAEKALEKQSGGKAVRRPRTKLRQGTLPLEIVSKGRFDRSEPTIHQGEDLDVPTYVRRGVPLN